MSTGNSFYDYWIYISHHALDAEGGRGTTYIIESGSYVKSRKNWRLISSFWAFDFPLRCTNKYTVYRRDDPFPRMCIALGNFSIYSSIRHNSITKKLLNLSNTNVPYAVANSRYV